MTNLKTGDSAIDFKLRGVDSRDYSLKDFAQKRALAVFFWCNHCPYVKAWEGRVIEISRAYAEKRVAFLAINSNDDKAYPDDSFDEMVKRSKQKAYSFPYLRDEDQSVARKYGAERTPEFFVFDEDRKLVYHGTVDDNYSDSSKVQSHYLRDALDAILEERAPRIPTTQLVGCTIKWK